MGLLSIFANSFSESRPRLEFDPKRCLRSRLSTNQCKRCLESCPSTALSEDSRKIRLDIEQCTGCMACVAACPQDAFASDHDLDEMLSSCQPGDDIVISCIHQVQNHPEEKTIPCVGILSKQVLAAMFLNNCRSVTFNLVGCAGCCNRSVSSAFLADCKLISEKLSDLNVTEVILVEISEQLSNPKIDRRSYLTKICDIAVDVSKKRLSSKQVISLVEPRNSRSIPFKTQLVRKMLTSLDEESQGKILGLFGHNLSVNENCNCCPLCKGICPTGSIKIDRSDQGKSLKFEMLDCSGCGLCVEFCKKNALSLQ